MVHWSWESLHAPALYRAILRQYGQKKGNGDSPVWDERADLKA